VGVFNNRNIDAILYSSRQMKIREIFNPIHRFFSINFEKRITSDLELSLYESKRSYVQALGQKQYWDSQVEYHKLRLNTLTEMFSTQKGETNVKKFDIITTINPYASQSRISDPVGSRVLNA
jgi:hypothetical protein